MTGTTRQFKVCPRCRARLIPTPSFAGPDCKFWLECEECNTFVNTYYPQPHQAGLHRDPHKLKGNFGGYGSGKTLTDVMEALKHLLITPNAVLLIGANVTSQYEQTIRLMLECDLPEAFVAAYDNKYNYVDLINGARIIYRPFDDPDKLRSYNLTMFIIVEGSEVQAEAFHQLKTRLRNLSAATMLVDKQGELVYETNEEGIEVPVIQNEWTEGIVESNPDVGWIRTDLLLLSNQIHKYGAVADEYAVDTAKMDKDISSHITASSANAFLPKGWMDMVTRNKPSWWIQRYIYGSFVYSEGLVYPNAMKAICPSFPVPPNWPRLAGHDYGLSDKAAFVFLAIDEIDGVIYAYKERGTSNRDLGQLADIFRAATEDIPIGGWWTTPFIDPKSGPKRDYNKKSLVDLYSEEGIIFQPGAISVDARIYRMNTYINTGKLRIMDCCTELIGELKEYKFPARTLNDAKEANKPVDKNNHYINATEWPLMALPADPKQLRGAAYDRFSGSASVQEERMRQQCWQLADEPDLNTGAVFGINKIRF